MENGFENMWEPWFVLSAIQLCAAPCW